MYCITRLPRASCTHSGLPSASSLVKVTYFSSTNALAAPDTVVGDGDDLTPEAVEQGQGGGGGVFCGQLRGALVLGRGRGQPSCAANQRLPASVTVSFWSKASTCQGENSTRL